jgi:hypothetical protein
VFWNATLSPLMMTPPNMLHQASCKIQYFLQRLPLISIRDLTAQTCCGNKTRMIFSLYS